jgi:hypothetical protein
MIYNDMSVVARFLEEIRKSGIPRTFQIWVYCDQVYAMQPQALLDVLNRDADRVFTFTPYWKQILKDQGVTRPIDVLKHGFQMNTCFPVPKELARKQLQLPSAAAAPLFAAGASASGSGCCCCCCCCSSCQRL